MTPKEAISWLVDTNLELALQYRCSIEREIWHVKRIYNNKLSEEVKRLLKTSINEIEPPTYPRPPCRESVASIFHKVPKINFLLIRAEYLDTINSL